MRFSIRGHRPYLLQGETTGKVKKMLPLGGLRRVPPREYCNIIEVDPEIPYAPVDSRNGVKYLKLGQWV
jgi:hypothetical protein